MGTKPHSQLPVPAHGALTKNQTWQRCQVLMMPVKLAKNVITWLERNDTEGICSSVCETD